MAPMTRDRADKIISEAGWLSQVSKDFRTRLLQNARLVRFAAGEVIFRPGDPPGGVYGLVSGTVTVDTAPPDSTPCLIHIALPGGWTGEDSFMTGEARRIELCARTETWAMHVPLDVMEQMAADDPDVVRAFGVMSILSSDVLLRIIHDLQRKNVYSRVASVLNRMSWEAGTSVTISQESLGVMANASRRQVNGAVRGFSENGWIEAGYRTITIHNPTALRKYVEQNIE